MSDTLLSQQPSRSQAVRNRPLINPFVGRRGRKLREALLAYLFLLPAFLIVGTFGLFPLIFAAYESSLRGLNTVLGRYDGLSNYVRALDNLTYVLALWLAALCLVLAVRSVVVAVRDARANKQNPWPWALPGLLIGLGLGLAAIFVFRALPEMLDVPNQMRGRGATTAQFRRLMALAFFTPAVQQALWGAVGLLAAGSVASTLLERNPSRRRRIGHYLGNFVTFTVLTLGGLALGWLTLTEINAAYAEALADGEGLALWAQIATISAGFGLLLAAWFLWESASDRTSNVSVVLRLGAGAMLLVGGWVLIGELPRIIAAGDPDWWIGLEATIWYSLGTVPVQLGLSLMLATLLFQEIKGRSFFRMVYFIPYIAPFVGTAAVFRILFSARPSALVNQLFTALGLDPLRWLNEPTGLFQLLTGPALTLPGWAEGPSLALVVIMVFGVWSFIGFNVVIFLAGLGQIPRNLYEAASIDGASRWAQFRHVTLPLLSPTIYFLTLYSVIGTFKAFEHIYVMRQAAALGTTDTVSVVIFQAFSRDTRFGYASALAILLLLIILALTFVNNRIASRRVFYG